MQHLHKAFPTLLPLLSRWCPQRWTSQLSNADELKIDKLVDAYKGYWEHIRFRKGWAVPAFSFEDVEIPMGIAAEYVVRIRNELDKKNPGMKMRLVDGNAQTYLQNVTKSETQKETFIRDLVHESLKDASGYVENLTKESVDSMLSTIPMSELSAPQIKVLRENMQLSVKPSRNEAEYTSSGASFTLSPRSEDKGKSPTSISIREEKSP